MLVAKCDCKTWYAPTEFAKIAAIGQNQPLSRLAKFSIPKFNKWQLFGKQPWVLFGSTRPFCDIQVSENHWKWAAGFGYEADFYVRICSVSVWTWDHIPTAPPITKVQPSKVGLFYACPCGLTRVLWGSCRYCRHQQPHHKCLQSIIVQGNLTSLSHPQFKQNDVSTLFRTHG